MSSGRPLSDSKHDHKLLPTLAPSSLTTLPEDILQDVIEPFLPVKETACIASSGKHLYGLFQQKAIDKVLGYAIFPTAENLEQLKIIVEKCPLLLLRRGQVKNRHGTLIEGTAFQIALHEADHELAAYLKAELMKLLDGDNLSEKQYKQQFPEGWLAREDKACFEVFNAIKQVVSATKAVSNPKNIIENFPKMLIINDAKLNDALSNFRRTMHALYQPSGVITTGRDMSIRLFERVLDSNEEHLNLRRGGIAFYNVLLITSQLYGFCQRFSPINYLQNFAQGIFYTVYNGDKLARTFKYRNGDFIFPLDSDLNDRLGYEHHAGDLGSSMPTMIPPGATHFKRDLMRQKQQLYKADAITRSARLAI